MATLIVPQEDGTIWPTLGPQICDFIEARAIFGPGPIAGEPAKLDAEKRAILYKLYEHYPKGHRLEGRRRFNRGAVCIRKGRAKTEFGMWIAYAELHSESPVRFDGWDANGNPVGRPAKSPFIPLMAFSKEQSDELGFSVLFHIVTEGPDSDLFDAGKDRILRLNREGREDGKASVYSGSANSRDGGKPTFMAYDEPHRMYSKRLKDAHNTLAENMSKLVMEDPWSLYVGTAGQPGQDSIQEDLHNEAEKIDRGVIKDPKMFYFYRWSPVESPTRTKEERIAAISEATGPIGEMVPGEFERIADGWDREGVEVEYLERVWLNRWRRQGAQAFDMAKWAELARPAKRIEPGAFITLGFDGARFKDATAFVATDIETGLQEVMGVWEKPDDDKHISDKRWEVPEAEVTAKFKEIMEKYEVWRLYPDPAHWVETVGAWAGMYPDHVVEFWTNQPKPMAMIYKSYLEAIDSGAVTHTDDKDFNRHVAQAGRRELALVDEEGKPLYNLQKQANGVVFDIAMAATLSWKARLDALRAGAKPKKKTKRVIRKLA